MGDSRPPGAFLVGRAAELARIADLVALTRAGRAATLLVAGPAGVGKTALVEHALADADLGDALALRGAGLPLTSLAAPFRTVRAMLRDAPGLVGVSTAGADDSGRAGTVDPVELDSRLDAVSAGRPVLLVVDDVQWVDVESLDVLRYVIAGRSDRAIGVVLTLRSEELVDGHPLHRWLADIRRLPGFEQLDLAPLDRYATELQMSGILGALPEASLVDEVFERSRGIPYLTRLLVRGVEPSSSRLPDDAPPGLEDAVLAAWHDLSPGARELTTVLAIAGQGLSRSDLGELVAERFDPADVVTSTAEAVAGSVLASDRHGRYWFHHPLQAELLERRADPDDRRAWHRACAVLLRSRLDDDRDPVRRAGRVAAVADHYHAAGDAEEAFAWSLRIVQSPDGEFSDQHVARALRLALTVRPAVQADGPGAEELLWRLREVMARLGDLPGELEVLDALAALPDGDRSPEEVVELRMRRAGVRYLCRQGELPVAEEEEIASLAARCPGTWQQAMAQARFAFAALMRPAAVDDRTHARARRAGAAALRTAEAIGHDAATAFALANASRVAYFEDDLDGAAELAARGLEHAVRSRDFSLYTLCVLMEANALGVYLAPETRDLLLQRRDRAVELGAPHQWVAALSEHVARVSVALGDTTTAERMVRFSLGAPPGPLADVGVRLAAARLAVLRGHLHEAGQHWARVSELLGEGRYDGLGDQCVKAELLSATGDHRGALRVCLGALDRGADRVSFGEWLLPLAARALADLAEELRAAGAEPPVAEDERRRLEGAYPPVVDEAGPGSPIPVDGSLTDARYRLQRVGLDAWYAAELARARGAAEAAGWWRRAARAFDGGGLPWEAAYAWLRLGEAHLRADRPDRREAARALRRAIDRGARLGAAPVTDRAAALATRAGLHLDDALALSDDRRLQDLTPREREVLGHVVQGRTYAQIAEALFLSEKTVSSHISNMLRKTGAANRHELAARAQTAQRRTG